MTAMAETTHFGERTVPLEEKQGLVNAVFHGVADRYDLMNDLMSGGVHRLWKDAMVARLAPPKTGIAALSRARHGGRHRRHRRAHPQCLGRLCRGDGRRHQFRHAAGRRRAGQELALRQQAKFVEANAEELPFEDESFDAYTIAFGIRNVPRIDKALSEAYRVLKRGGRFLCLEFSPVDVPGLDRLYKEFSRPRHPADGHGW